MARPNKGAAHVDDLKGSQRSNRRVKLILATLSGEMSVADACKELEVGPTQFANLCEPMLQGALDALEPRPVGRPRVAATPTPADVEELEDQVIELAGDNALLQAKPDANEALRAGGASKRPPDGKAEKKGSRRRGRAIPAHARSRPAAQRAEQGAARVAAGAAPGTSGLGPAEAA